MKRNLADSLNNYIIKKKLRVQIIAVNHTIKNLDEQVILDFKCFLTHTSLLWTQFILINNWLSTRSIVLTVMHLKLLSQFCIKNIHKGMKYISNFLLQ